MSAISDEAKLTLLMADYAAAEQATGKLNVIGGSIRILGFTEQGTTSRFTVVGLVDVPSRLCPAEAAVEIVLLDGSGDPVDMPGMAGKKIRFAQVAKFEKPSAQRLPMLPAAITAMHQMVLELPTGLPLRVGTAYRWSLRIDGDVDHERTLDFFVAGPPPAPVVG